MVLGGLGWFGVSDSFVWLWVGVGWHWMVCGSLGWFEVVWDSFGSSGMLWGGLGGLAGLGWLGWSWLVWGELAGNLDWVNLCLLGKAG